MAFGMFSRHRRDDEPPVWVEDPATEPEVVTVVATPPLSAESELAAAEALLPRWRRPSLLLARRTDSFRDAKPVPRLTFEEGQGASVEGQERRLIRYRLVRMLDTPDELRGTETGYLDRGDEVQLLERHGAFWLVARPDGRQGWVHNMTLGETVDDLIQADLPEVTGPPAADAWSTEDADDGNTDVLDAYLDSRRRGL
jgi:hypothetical protein